MDKAQDEHINLSFKVVRDFTFKYFNSTMTISKGATLMGVSKKMYRDHKSCLQLVEEEDNDSEEERELQKFKELLKEL